MLLSVAVVLSVFMNFSITVFFNISIPSALRSIDYLMDNKQINFNCFCGILPTKSRVSLKFVTSKLNIIFA